MLSSSDDHAESDGDVDSGNSTSHSPSAEDKNSIMLTTSCDATEAGNSIYYSLLESSSSILLSLMLHHQHEHQKVSYLRALPINT